MIHELLGHGKDSRHYTGKELAAYFGCTIREITRRIKLESADYPICAITCGRDKGYFLAATKEELKEHCDSLHRRASSIYGTRANLLKQLDSLPDEKGA